MRVIILKNNLVDVIKQRNELLVIMLAMLGIIILLSIALASGFGRDERVIIIPPNMHAVGYVDKNGVSDSYLSDMTRYYALMFLDVTPSDAASETSELLRYAAPESYGALKDQLLAQSETLKKHQLSLRFVPNSTEVDSNALVADITGDLHFYVGKAEVNNLRVTYRVHYRLHNGSLLISGFNVLSKTGDKNA